jgi:poly(A) polymerase
MQLTQSSWLNWPQTQQLISIFEEAGQEIRFVGGAVRDLLAGKAVTDVDVATPASPQQVMGILEKAGIRTIPTGLSHGTVTALIDEQPFEITTLRCDIKSYGRHAEVQFTRDWEQDAARRDFTINALYCDPQGRIYDYHNGLEDLRGRHVRFIGDAKTRIEEDGLRILRFFRFTARYGEGKTDEAGLAACHECREMLEQLSGERIAQEMLKLLQSDQAVNLLALMDEQRLTLPLFGYRLHLESAAVWPRVQLMADIAEAELLAPQEVPLLLIALLARAQEGALAEFVIQRWKLSNKQAEFLNFLIQAPLIDSACDEAEQKRLLRRYGAAFFYALALISWTETLRNQNHHAQMLSAAYRPMLWLAGHWQPPAFPLTGDDLTAAGVTPGPGLGAWLKQLEEWWESEGYQPDKAELLKRFHAQR